MVETTLAKYRVDKLWDDGAYLMEIEPDPCPIGLGMVYPLDTPEKKALNLRVGAVLTFRRRRSYLKSQEAR
jgi:hypothetical protein